MSSGLLYPTPQLPILNSDTEMGQDNTLKVPTPRPISMRSRARRRRSSSQSSLHTEAASLSSFSSQAIVSSPNIVITRRGSLSRNQPVFTFAPRVNLIDPQTVKPKRKTKRRRIRTFYSNGRWNFDFSKKRLQTTAGKVEPKFPVNPVPLPCGPPSPSPMPMMDHQHLSVDMDFGESLSYDSAASNMAANNDLDRRMADDEDEDEFSDLDVPDLPINTTKRDSQFTIVVSAPEHAVTMDSRLTAKRAQLRFCGSDMECATDDCGSSDDCEDESELFLSDNDQGIGIFSSFPGVEQSDTDYLSAQSDDFEDLTICARNDRQNRNIRYRRHGTPKYLSSAVTSEMGSSVGSNDTDLFSSADSLTLSELMQRSMPSTKFAPMVAK